MTDRRELRRFHVGMGLPQICVTCQHAWPCPTEASRWAEIRADREPIEIIEVCDGAGMVVAQVER